MTDVDEQFILNEEALDDLYAWIDTIPLSRPKKNIARDFSDGVMCAEAVAHFMPKLVDTHNYVTASSMVQKKVNWNTLNRKVFQKMGVRLSEPTIQQLVEAKPGAIEQVLWDIRRKVQEQISGRQQDDGRNRRSIKPPSSRPVSGYQSHQQQQYQQEQAEYLDRPTAYGSRTSMSYGGPTSIPVPINYTVKGQVDIGGYKSQTDGFHPTSSYQQGYIVPPGRSASALSNNDNGNNLAGGPSQIVYRGHKMVALAILEEKEREMKSLEQANKNLSTKVHRIETLVNVKDQRIEDLTHQLHNLRAMYERVTQQTWQGY